MLKRGMMGRPDHSQWLVVKTATQPKGHPGNFSTGHVTLRFMCGHSRVGKTKIIDSTGRIKIPGFPFK
jgi:hypothetical protein